MLVTTYIGTSWVCYVRVLLCRINSVWGFKDHVHCKMLPVILNGTALSGLALTLWTVKDSLPSCADRVVTEDLV